MSVSVNEETSVVVRPDLGEDEVCLWWVVVVVSAVQGQS